MADDKYGYYRTRTEDGTLKVEFHGEEASQPSPKTKQGTGSVGPAKKTGTSATESNADDDAPADK